MSGITSLAIQLYSWLIRLYPVLFREEFGAEMTAVFAGDFDLEAAGHIAGAAPLLLQSLVDKSLLSANRSNRYRLHELLRQFSARKLGANRARQRQTVKGHCAYFANLLHHYELESKSDLNSIGGNLMRTQGDSRNIQAAWLFASNHCLVTETSNLTYFLSLFYEFQGLIREGKANFTQAIRGLKNCGSQVPPLAMMRLLAHFGWICQDLNEEKLAKQSLEEALNLAADLDAEGVSSPDNADVSLTLFFLGWTTHVQGQSARGISLLKRSQELSQAANYELGLVLSRLALSVVEYDNGNYSLALAYLAQIPTDIGPFHTQFKLGQLGISSSALGNYADAANYLRQMIDSIQSLPNIMGFLLTLTGIAALFGHQGYYVRGVELIAVHLNHPQSGGFPVHWAETLLKEFRPMLTKHEFQQVMDKAKGGQLDISFLASSFGPNPQMIKRLSVLLDQAAAGGGEG